MGSYVPNTLDERKAMLNEIGDGSSEKDERNRKEK